MKKKKKKTDKAFNKLLNSKCELMWENKTFRGADTKSAVICRLFYIALTITHDEAQNSMEDWGTPFRAAGEGREAVTAAEKTQSPA